MLSDVLIGIDMGTGSSKGVATTITGEILATSTRPRPNSMSMPRPGWAEVDADAIWWADVVSLCQELTARVADHQLAGVCVSGVGPCLVLCDENDRPVRPAILYGIDMRATAEIEELTERYGQQAILDRGRTALTTQAVGPKALWVRRNKPEVWTAPATGSTPTPTSPSASPGNTSWITTRQPVRPALRHLCPRLVSTLV